MATVRIEIGADPNADWVFFYLVRPATFTPPAPAWGNWYWSTTCVMRDWWGPGASEC